MKQRLIQLLKKVPFVRFIYEKRLLITFKIFSIFPVKKNAVIFESFLGKQYSDNPRAVYEYMAANIPQMKLYWSFDKSHLQNYKNLQLNTITRLSLKWIYMMATTKYWVSNSRLPLWIPKPKHTVYIQTWHGTPLKKLGVDIKDVKMPGTTTEKYHKNFAYEASKWDFLISPNTFSTDIFKHAFQFTGEILETGYPRNDYLYTHNNVEEIKNLKMKYQLPLDKKVILYAPTWRDNEYYDVGQYKFKLKLNLKEMRRELGADYVILFRLHYLVSDQIDLKEFKGFAFNCSDALDIRELYMLSDMLITDYSSVFFDYANLKRPIIFFTYDVEDYRDNLRGFYIDFEKDAPGPFATTTSELIQHIKVVDSNNYNFNHLNKFYNRFCALEDGKASKRLVNSLFSK